MPKTDDGSPATKADIGLLMDSIGKLYDANEKWKDEILMAMKGFKNEIINEFCIASKNIIHEMLRLKKHTGLAA